MEIQKSLHHSGWNIIFFFSSFWAYVYVASFVPFIGQLHYHARPEQSFVHLVVMVSPIVLVGCRLYFSCIAIASFMPRLYQLSCVMRTVWPTSFFSCLSVDMCAEKFRAAFCQDLLSLVQAFVIYFHFASAASTCWSLACFWFFFFSFSMAYGCCDAARLAVLWYMMICLLG